MVFRERPSPERGRFVCLERVRFKARLARSRHTDVGATEEGIRNRGSGRHPMHSGSDRFRRGKTKVEPRITRMNQETGKAGTKRFLFFEKFLSFTTKMLLGRGCACHRRGSRHFHGMTNRRTLVCVGFLLAATSAFAQ